MSEYPVELSRLRQIGWDEWDPIGIRQIDDESWRTSAAQDEYDRYLLHVVNLLSNGNTVSEAAEYLNKIVSKDMGFGRLTDTGRAASTRTAEAIAAYLKTLP